MKRLALLRKTAIWIVGVVSFVGSGCSGRHSPDPSTPHGAMIGHWQRAKTQANPSNSNFEGTVDGGKTATEDLYIADSYHISVTPTSDPVRRTYVVQEQNPNGFSLKQYIIGPTGQKIFSEVKFSADRKEMHVINTPDFPSSMPSVIRDQMRGLTLDIVYRRVDDKISP